MFGLAFTLGLPILVIRPQKFALAFTTGSIFFCTALAVVRGVGPFLRSFLTSKRLPHALAYALTLVLTLWAACIRRSYILTVVFASMQIGFLGWSALMHMPGGGRGALHVLRKVVGWRGRSAGLCMACWSVLGDALHLVVRTSKTLSDGRDPEARRPPGRRPAARRRARGRRASRGAPSVKRPRSSACGRATPTLIFHPRAPLTRDRGGRGR